MRTQQVSVTGMVHAPAQTVYRILADYDHHHPQILPGQFKELVVEEGGVGEGTVFRLTAVVFGNRQSARMRVREPEPGRVLVETDDESGLVTTFTVEPDGEEQSSVTITTTWQPEPGLRGWIESVMTPRLLRRMYREELQKLDVYAAGLRDSASG